MFREFVNKIKEQVRILRVDSIRLRAKEYPSFSPSNLSVIVAPHPDDEVFGCCGLMQRLIALGKRVELIIMTDAYDIAVSRGHNPNKNISIKEV